MYHKPTHRLKGKRRPQQGPFAECPRDEEGAEGARRPAGTSAVRGAYTVGEVRRPGSIDRVMALSGSKHSFADLQRASLSAGRRLFGKELLYSKPIGVELTSLGRIRQEVEKGDESVEFVDDFEYIFFPSTGKGKDASGESFLGAASLLADKDGCIYTYSSGDSTLRIILLTK